MLVGEGSSFSPTGECQSMKGFERFQHAILEAAKNEILPLTARHRKAVGDALWNHLFDLKGPKEVSQKHTGQQIYFGKIFQAFTEVAHSLETLDDIAFYVGRFPFRETRITKDRYLQFHVESYFSELYLLQQRLQQYVVLLERQFRNDPRLPEIRAHCKHLPTLASKALEKPLRLRHSHVHQTRLSDSGINRLKTIGLLTQGKDDSMASYMRIQYRLVYSQVKTKLTKTLLANNEYVRRILDVFFGNLYPIVFEDSSGSLNYPSRLKFRPKRLRRTKRIQRS